MIKQILWNKWRDADDARKVAIKKYWDNCDMGVDSSRELLVAIEHEQSAYKQLTGVNA